ncbi:Protein kinase protein with adenine nucleotide alpha hydrolase-like domain [Zea mays]|uniref:RING-type E3 ubiquitin transferase n=1 Tax=Zea mays TaxID=4577 RepID=A0A1D6NKL9_MAIZE|nr:Protein kinase protein with adenine nucleotide alpha hydrolase-like domain [Zea mays]
MQGGPLSPDEYRVASPPALLHQPAPVIVVAIDRDRNSQLAAKWVVDHLLSGASQIVLLHVAAHYPANHGFAMAETTQSALEAEMKEIFVPYRGFFNRNGVDVFEVVLEEADVSKAILGYITANKIQSIALGGASRNAFTKKFKNADVPSTLMKCAPDYCNIYVVAKGKSVNVRLAKCGVPPMHGGADSPSDTDSVRESGLYIRRGSRGHGHLPPVMPDARRSMDGRSTLPELTTRPPFRERSLPSSATKNVVVLPGKDYSEAPSRSARHDSFGGDLDFGPSTRFSSMDFGDNLDLTARRLLWHWPRWRRPSAARPWRQPRRRRDWPTWRRSGAATPRCARAGRPTRRCAHWMPSPTTTSGTASTTSTRSRWPRSASPTSSRSARAATAPSTAPPWTTPPSPSRCSGPTRTRGGSSSSRRWRCSAASATPTWCSSSVRAPSTAASCTSTWSTAASRTGCSVGAARRRSRGRSGSGSRRRSRRRCCSCTRQSRSRWCTGT